MEPAYPIRNITLDYFRMILTLLIISAHSNTSTYGLGGWLISDGITRIAVPCFFIINGFFFAPLVDNPAKVKKYFKHIIILYIVWTLIYFPLCWDMIGGGKKMFLILLITGYYHLWYMAAMIGAVICIYLMRKLSLNLVMGISMVLYLIGYLIQKAYMVGIHIHMYPTISRNFLFIGIPFVFLGYYINKKNLCNKPFAKGKGIIVVSVILSLILLVESYVVYSIKGHEVDPPKDDFFISLIPLCLTIFLIVQSRGKYVASDGFYAKLSSGVYFIHIMVIFLLLRSPYQADVTYYPMFLFISLLLGLVLIQLNKRIKIFL